MDRGGRGPWTEATKVHGLPVHDPVWPVLTSFGRLGPVWPCLADRPYSVPETLTNYGRQASI